MGDLNENNYFQIFIVNLLLESNCTRRRDFCFSNRDLMGEHGILNRVLLIYEEIIKRLKHNKKFEINILRESVSIIKDFIEDYHEKNEEQYIFPKFKDLRKYRILTNTLTEQHNAGRKVMSEVQKIITKPHLDNKDKAKVASLLKKFVRMYRVH